MNDLECVCLSAFTGCQLPLFCSTAAQYVSSYGRFGRTGFVQSCSTPGGGTWKWCYISSEPTRQEETSADWKSLCDLYCFVSHRFVSVRVVFLQRQ